MIGLHIALRPGGGGIGSVALELFLLFLRKIPHGQEGNGHGPHRVPLQPDGGVLPVAEAGLDVDIFVRHVDAAGKGHLAVHDHILPVVPVVLPQGQDRHHPVEHPAVDAQLFQPGRIVRRKGENGAHVVVNDPDLHPFLHLFLQNAEDGIPELALFNDEILDENIPLRPADGAQQILVADVPQRVELRPGVAVHRAAGRLFQIAGHPPGVLPGQPGQRGRAAAVRAEILADLALHGPEPPLVVPGQPVAAQKQVSHRAEGHEQHDDDDPADLVPRVAPVARDPQHHQRRQQRHRAVEGLKIRAAAHERKGRPVKGQLHHDERGDDGQPVEHQLAQPGKHLRQRA